MIPLWALFAVAASLLICAIPLIQEKFKADGFSVAFWAQVTVLAISTPLALWNGLPEDPRFYAAVVGTALLWSVSDVIYFTSVPKVGAGIVSRLLPSAVIISFILWFIIDPALLDKYLARPWQAIAICVIILASVILTTLIRRCSFSWQAVRMIWFIIFAASIGPVIVKFSLGYAPASQAPLSYMCINATFMVTTWLIYYAIRKPVPTQTLLSGYSMRTGTLIGLFGATTSYLKTNALLLVEHPAYVQVILFSDSLWILLIYRLMGRKENGSILPSLGIVACAVALVIVKSL